MEAKFFPPPLAFKEFVKESWIWSGVDSNKLPTILPSYECELVIHLSIPPLIEDTNGNYFQVPRVHWIGPQSRPWKISANQSLDLFSIRFFPGALYALHSMKMKNLLNSFIGVEQNKADEIFTLISDAKKNDDTFSKDQVNQIVIDVINKLSGQRKEVPVYVQFAAIELMRGKSSIIQICNKMGISKKQLERKFF